MSGEYGRYAPGGHAPAAGLGDVVASGDDETSAACGFARGGVTVWLGVHNTDSDRDLPLTLLALMDAVVGDGS